MNKNKLLEFPLIEGTEKAISEYVGDIRILTAQVRVVGGKKTMNIDVYEKTGLKARFFYTNKEKLAYVPEQEKWTSKAFRKVLDGDYYWKSVTSRFLKGEMRLKVEKFFRKYGSSDSDYIERIEAYEDSLNSEKTKKRRQKKEAAERAERTACNQIPKRMKKWLFEKLPVYFMQNSTGETTCTCCGKSFQTELKKHLSGMKCPICKKEGTVQRLSRCKRFFYHQAWGLLYDTNKSGEEVLRYVHSSYRIIANKENQTFELKKWYGELARVYYDRAERFSNFEAPYGKFIISSKHYLSTGGLCNNSNFCGICYMYPFNQEKWIQNIISSETEVWDYLVYDLRNEKRRAFYERLSKAGYSEMARTFALSYMSNIREVNLNESKLINNLSLNRSTLKILKVDQSIEAWRFLKEIPDITQEKFDTWTNSFGYNVKDYKRFKNPMKVCEYLNSQNWTGKKRDLLNSYIHYLDIIEEYGEDLGISLKSKSVRYPSDFKKADDNLTRDYKILMERKRAEKKALYDKNYAEMAEELKKAMAKSDAIKKFLEGTSGLLVKIPETREELVKEGNRLHNCLATYAEKMAEGKTTIFFIRKIDAPDKEFFAMEYKDGEIKQLRTYHNHSDESGKIVAFADAFATVLKSTNFVPPRLAA